MLSVDFIESLGITAKKISVTSDVRDSYGTIIQTDTLFEADGTGTEPNITLGDWLVKKDESPLERGWVFRMEATTGQTEESSYPNEESFNVKQIRFENVVRFLTSSSAENGIIDSISKTELDNGGIMVYTTTKKLKLEDTENYKVTGYIFYYLCKRGLRFRICKTRSFKDLLYFRKYNDTFDYNGSNNTEFYGYAFDFPVAQIGNFTTAGNGGSDEWL
jgi:hypothetical protein